VKKAFRFKKDSYLSTVTTEATLDGKPIPHLIQWRGGFGDLTIANAAANQRTLYFDLAENKLVEQAPKSAAKGPVNTTGNHTFAGIADTYFAAVFLSEDKSGMQEVTFDDTVKTVHEQAAPVMLSGVAVGSGTANRFEPCFHSSPVRWSEDPVPLEQYDSLPGFFFAYSTSSFIEFGARSGRVMSTFGVVTASVTGAKSFAA